MTASFVCPSVAEPDLLALTQEYLIQQEARRPSNQRCRDAWERFYEIHRRKIRAFAFTCGVEPADVVDCEQEVWRELLLRLPTFHIDLSRGQFDSWLFAIVRSKAVDLFRARKYRSRENGRPLDDCSDRRHDPAARIEPAEIFALAMDQLRARVSGCNFQIIKMRLLDGNSVAEVARSVDLSHEQVWYRYHRTRRELAEICTALLDGQTGRKQPHDSELEKKQQMQKIAQGETKSTVSPKVGESAPLSRGAICVDYVFKKVELGRRTLNHEWKVEWTCDVPPTPMLFIRKVSMVAYAEVCGAEELVNNLWPRIANATVAAGVAAGIATILATPSAALPIFRAEFKKHFQGKGADLGPDISVALSSQLEPNGPWCECKE